MLRSHPRRMLYILLGLTIVIALFLVITFPLIARSTSETRTLHIPHGATEESVRDSLARYYGEDFAKSTMRMASVIKKGFYKRAGAYSIEKGSSPLTVARRIAGGAQTPVRLTINGFRDFDEMMQRIGIKFEFSADSLSEAVKSPSVLTSYGLTPEQAMALFVNDTYELYWSASPDEVIRKIGDNYNRLWNGERRAKAEALGLTPAQVMILASIVDEETNLASEKGTIGRLYINRLNKGMRLQSDPTVRFALGDFTIRRVLDGHLSVDSPYNTYRNAGLPPGPIRTTGKATVDAILDSKPNNYLYMCAKEDFSGGHNFAVTFDEHSANARAYRKALDERGIK